MSTQRTLDAAGVVSAIDEREMLDGAIADVYRGPLEDFVRRRDALAKELRSAGKRDAASTVKGLRKPSRMAWALNLGALDRADAFDAVVAALASTVDAQAAGGDVRAAIAALRTAVREFGSQAAQAAGEAGQRMESGVLANALFTVLGDTESFDQLRRGHLADIPEAGGLDLLTTLLVPQPQISRAAPPKVPAAAVAAEPSPDRATLENDARDIVRQSASAVAGARQRAAATQEALRSVESKLRSAEERLRKAEEDVRTLRSQRDGARKDAEAAAAALSDAEAAAAAAERRLDDVIRTGP